MARRFVVGFALLLALGCGSGQSTQSETAKSTGKAKALADRETPLREEVDDVAPVRDAVLKNSGQ